LNFANPSVQMEDESLSYTKSDDDPHREIPFFSTREQLQYRRGRLRMGRFKFLQSLVTEFSTTHDSDAKEQVLANLANFAYDPVNYDWLRSLCVIDLFLDNLDEPSVKIKQYAVGGLCNLCLDPKNASIIIDHDGLPLLLHCLSSSNEETVLSSITTLFFLLSERTKKDILTPAVLSCLRSYSSSLSVRLKNIATVFLQHPLVSSSS